MTRVLKILLIAFAVAALPTFAQDSSDDTKQEIEALKKNQEEMKKQLEEIKKLLQQRPAPAPARPAGPDVKDVEFDLAGAEIKGDPKAPLMLVEMTDYQCPFCGRYATQTEPQIKSEYVESGKLRYALLDMPLESIHKNAFKAAEATHCAKDQGKYWEMHDRLFENQRALEPFSAHAEALKLDVKAFDECMSSNKYAQKVRENMQLAAKAGARGTPSFLLARTDPDDPTKVKGITTLRGAQPFTSFKAQIDNALNDTN